MSRQGTEIGVVMMRAAIALWSLSLTQCSDSAAPTVPIPQLDRVEPAVAAKLNRCRAAVLADPSASNWATYARTLHAHEMLAEAERAYLATVEILGADNPAAFDWLHLAGCATLEWKPTSAAEHFARALTLRTDFPATHLNLGVVSERLGRLEEAKRHYKSVTSRWRSSHANLGLGRLAMIGGDPAAAIALFDTALKINPKLRAVHEAMARAYARMGKRSASRAAALRAGDLERATTIRDPLIITVIAERVDLDSRIARGIQLAKNNRDADAITELEAAVAAIPRHSEARFVLASILYKADRKSEACKHLDTLLAEHQTHKRALELRARILIDAGDRNAAAADLKALLAIDADHAWARAELAKDRDR